MLAANSSKLAGATLVVAFKMPGIFLYAEVLQNIRQITLYATLQTNKNEGTKVEISSDKRYITVHHDDQTAKLLLPLEVSGTAELTLPVEKAKDLSLRLALEDTDAVVPQSDENDSNALWSASFFNADGCLRCRQCDNQLTPPGATFVWKDLPSENWAEMMDFWHCHKPHEENQDDSTTEGTVAGAKGYGANSRIRAIKGTVLIDSSTFLITKEDGPGVEVSTLLAFPIRTEKKVAGTSASAASRALATDTNVLEQHTLTGGRLCTIILRLLLCGLMEDLYLLNPCTPCIHFPAALELLKSWDKTRNKSMLTSHVAHQSNAPK